MEQNKLTATAAETSAVIPVNTQSFPSRLPFPIMADFCRRLQQDTTPITNSNAIQVVTHETLLNFYREILDVGAESFASLAPVECRNACRSEMNSIY